MFETLAEKLNRVFKDLRKRGKLSAEDVDASLREVRLALLEADVNYKVAKEFLGRVRERSIGGEVSKALNPAQQVIKIVHEELINLLGEPAKLNLSGPKPRVIMLAGLQGSGKTTASAKIANLLRKQGERVLLVAADPYRPAAIKQLQLLGEKIGVDVFSEEGKIPPIIARDAFSQAEKGGISVLIIDTAGRSQLDRELMEELSAINNIVKPIEILLVVDAMLGQEAIHIAEGFHKSVAITGVVFTKMDGDSRGGSAISIRSVTGVPIKYLGTGEGIDALETYDPNRLASRILGMGDIIGLIEKAEDLFDAEQSKSHSEKMLNGQFTLVEFSEQIKQIKKMGPFGQILEMLPGNMGQMAKMVSPQDAEKQLKLTEAVINSMTMEERVNPEILNANRRRRIAKGSGTEVQDVNRLLKQFRDAQKLFKTLQKTGGRGMSRLFG